LVIDFVSGYQYLRSKWLLGCV